ncbi:MAG: tetratricopeptide repeat protein [Acidobacteriaceae bacterium]|nr:tetratricopeptide repeat protein [Acidobacteriaceae bacterium]
MALLLASVALSAQEPAACRNGLNLFHENRVQQAQGSLWECIESGKGDADDALTLAQTYKGLRNYESGLNRATADLQKLPDSVDLIYIAAYLHYRRNETKESMLLATKAYRLAPNDWRIHQLLALNYISFDMLEAAKLSLNRAISLKPDNAELLYQLARLYFALGSFVDSIEISKKALVVFPDYPEVYHNLALCYEGNGNIDMAMQNFQKAIDLNRKFKRQDEWPLIDFAVYQRMGGHPEASLPLLEEALGINPKSPKANYEMGELLRDERRFVEAKQYLETAVALDPCNARALYGLAVLMRQLGDAERSKALLQRFKEVDKETKSSTNAATPCGAGSISK